jgi:hypothetical protein
MPGRGLASGSASSTVRHTGRSGHPAWCAGGHRCGLGEHRADPIRVDITGAGSLVITRVRGWDGRDYAEVRGSLRLSPDGQRARGQLLALVAELGRLMWRAARSR